MRPTKLTHNVLTAFKKVLSDELNVLVCTDDELFILVNDLLEPEDRISYRSFQRYKAQAIKEGIEMDFEVEVLENAEVEVPAVVEKQALIKELYLLWKRAIIKQKRNLMKRMLQGKAGYLRYKWIFERKFIEWSGKLQPEAQEPKYLKPYILRGNHNGRGITNFDGRWYYNDPVIFDKQK